MSNYHTRIMSAMKKQKQITNLVVSPTVKCQAWWAARFKMCDIYK